MLVHSIKKYHNKFLTVTETMAEIIKLSKEIINIDSDALNLGLTDFDCSF